MADYKIVDGEKLDQDLTSVANAIRDKSGTTGTLPFPAGFVSAISSISNVATVTINNGGNLHNSPVIYLDENGVRQRVSPGQTKTVQTLGGILIYPYIGTEDMTIESDCDLPEQFDHDDVYWFGAIPDGAYIEFDI